ncbi:MAG: hypothetical protein JWO62_2699 [Acidimicrobiaceae bacterium]|nr:hypothetical protein [Acidimicrobiaceae bacterium]
MRDWDASMAFASDKLSQENHRLLLSGGHNVPRPLGQSFETLRTFGTQLPYGVSSTLHRRPLPEAIAICVNELDRHKRVALAPHVGQQVLETLFPCCLDRVP